MPGIKSILAATDFSKSSEHAQARAALLCRQHPGSTLELINVKETIQLDVLAQIMNSTVEAACTEITNQTEKALQHHAAQLRDQHGVTCKTAVRFGMPAAEVLARAEEIDADLTVAGAHGGNLFSRLFLGNTADRLAHLCKRPLLIVKNAPQQAYRHVLVPVDFSDDSKQAAQLALSIAPQASLTFLHACEAWYEGVLQYANVSRDAIEDYRLREGQEAHLALNQFIQEMGSNTLSIQRVIEFGMPGAAIRDYAKTHGVDLIVMGKHGKSRLEALLLGSVTRDTLDESECDVLIVPPGKKPA